MTCAGTYGRRHMSRRSGSGDRERKRERSMSIWKILGIEPTTDKRAIRRAYAAKTRKIHPEDAPEEFQELHEAYQAALGYAEYVRQVEQSGGSITSFYIEGNSPAEGRAEENAETDAVEDTGGDAAEPNEKDAPESAGESAEEGETARDGETTEETEREELRAYFEENEEKHGQQAAAFLERWKEFHGPYHDQGVMEWWKEYLASEEFQDIRYHSQVLKTLADEIDDKCFYGIDEVKMLFWEAYGFQEGEETAYQGDLQRLCRSLYPAYEKQQRNIQYEQRWAKNDKILRIFIGAAVAVFLAVCILIPVTIHRQRENGRLFLIDYMAKRYPETTFSEPERLEKDKSGYITYNLYSAAHPEWPVTAKVEIGYVEGKRVYLVTEDYDQLLFEYYAAQYGLEGCLVSYTGGTYADPETVEYATLLYADIGEVDSFCESAVKMFREQEELQRIPEVAVCTESVLFPQVLLYGGVPDFSFAERQAYDLRSVEAKELSEGLQDAYRCYMFLFEAWNITPEQYREWGEAYEKRSGEWENEDGEWHEERDSDTGELLCRFFIPTYDWLEGVYSGEKFSMPMYTRMITVGNAYYFLKDRGANLTVNEDGSGFTVTFYGNVTDFGREPSVEFYDLRDCY